MAGDGDKVAKKFRVASNRYASNIAQLSKNQDEEFEPTNYTELYKEVKAVDVPRGFDSTEDELTYILNHADCKIAFVENQAQIDKIASQIKAYPTLELFIAFEQPAAIAGGLQIRHFGDLLATVLAPEEEDLIDGEIYRSTADELVTIICTSGTTKVGEELTHTLKVRRNVVEKKYAKEPQVLFA